MKNNPPLYYGENITSSGTDLLRALSPEVLFDKIINPGEAFLQLFNRLKEVRKLDKQVFDRMKVKLPYFTGSQFEPLYRKSENFLAIRFFILDIDGLKEDETKIQDLINRLKKDNRLLLMFRSPSGEGLKLVFRLIENQLVPSEYTSFYKSFCLEAARYYGLEKHIDFKTCDVTRVCFLSYDPGAYFNNDADDVNPDNYISEYDLFKTKEDGEEIHREEEKKNELSEEIYAELLKKLNPKSRPRKKNIFIPEALNSIVEPVKVKALSLGISITEILDIQYGRKFRFTVGLDKAEINVFYGKKGFSVVICPVKEHCETLSELTKIIIETVIYECHKMPLDPGASTGAMKDLLSGGLTLS